jgi:hypothetical protein
MLVWKRLTTSPRTVVEAVATEIPSAGNGAFAPFNSIRSTALVPTARVLIEAPGCE